MPVKEIFPWHFFPTACLKFPNFECEYEDCSCMDTEWVKDVIKSGHFCVVSVYD